MADKLVVPVTFQIQPEGGAARTESFAQDVIKVGRDLKSHLRIDEEGVGRMHAVIEVKPDDVQIIDLGSGTMVNGQPINKAALRSGDVIQIGRSRITVDIGAPREAGATPAFVPPTVVGSAVTAGAGPGAFSDVASSASVAPGDGDEIYQLIKRGEINPHEVEEVGSQTVEVNVMWKSSILHVAHLTDSNNFLLSAREAKKAPTSTVTTGILGVGGLLMAAGAYFADPQHLNDNRGLIVGGVGFATALAGTGVGVALGNKNHKVEEDTSRFLVGPEVIGGADELPVVINNSGTRFVFLPGATGEVELQGVKRSLEDLKSQGHARPSSAVPGGFEVNIQPDGRYRQEIGGLTIVAKVVAPGRVVAGHLKREPALIGSFVGAFLLIGAFVGVMRFAISDDSGFLSSNSDDDRLAELRAFIQRQQERQPEQQPQQNANDQQEGGTGTRHRGDEGKMGRRDTADRNRRYAIRNNNEPPHLSRNAAREAVQNRGVFAALGAAGGMAAASSGIVNPFGAMTESGLDDRNAQGNMTGDSVGDAFGYGGLGAAGTGWGGGGTGEGTIGMGSIGTMGHGSGTGSGQGYGSGAGRGLRNRGTTGPTVRAAPPSVSGLLSPEAIRRVVLRNLGQVNRCYEQGLATSPNIAGRVVVRFVIGGTGTVIGSSVADSSIAVPSVGECIANAVRRWQFPAPEGNGVVTVNYPFNLQPADQ
ncbi:MAG: TonB family protein [Polyangiales bacterium]